MNFVLDIEVVPQEFAETSPKARQYVWERVLQGLRREDPEDPRLDLTPAEFLRLRAEEPARAADLDERVREFMTFRAEFGHIICIGCGHDGKGGFSKKALMRESVAREREILEEFWEIAKGEHRDWCYVTFNGLSFDLPYILKRSLYLGVPPTTTLPLRRYAPGEHFDVMQVLANWDRRDAIRLDVVAELFGMEKRPKGIDGSEVYRLWTEGRRAEIEEYCLNDVQLIYDIYQRVRPYFG